MAVSPSLIAEAVGWRREFHAAPELGYQEQETSRRVAELLASFGLQVHRGLAGTGVVATLENGPGPVIGLRADMDALPITELGSVSYRSRRAGVMHACGHDGHTAMLLAAAAHLAQTRHFSGTVHFVFQPAEENLGGARKMVEEGLFERFPMDAIYALHNWPGIPLGEVALSDGAMMASLDAFEITLRGKSCHAAMPESGADPIVAAAQLIMALQTIPSRRLSPQDSAVVSITQINGGEAIKKGPQGGRWAVRRAAAAFHDVVSVVTTGYNGGSGSAPTPVSDGENATHDRLFSITLCRKGVIHGRIAVTDRRSRWLAT